MTNEINKELPHRIYQIVEIFPEICNAVWFSMQNNDENTKAYALYPYCRLIKKHNFGKMAGIWNPTYKDLNRCYAIIGILVKFKESNLAFINICKALNINLGSSEGFIKSEAIPTITGAKRAFADYNLVEVVEILDRMLDYLRKRIGK